MTFNNLAAKYFLQYLSRSKRLLLFTGLVLWQAAGQAANLLDIYQLAREHDPVYAQAESSWQASREKLPQARASLLPTLQFTASTDYNSVETDIQGGSSAGGKRDYNTTAYGLTLRQPLYRGQDWMQYEQSELQLKQSDAQLLAASQDLILRVSQAYFDVLAAQDNMETLTAQKKAIEKQLLQAKRKFEVGSNTVIDVNEAQASYDLVVAQEIAAKNQLLIANRSLGKIIGSTPPELDRLDAGWKPSNPDPDDEQQWMQRALDSNPGVLQQTSALLIAEREIDRQQAGYYPTLDLVANYSDESADDSSIFGAAVDTTSKSIGLQLSVPLYGGGITSSLKREAVHNKEATRHALDNAQRNAEFDSSQSFIGVIDGIARVSALEQAVVSSKSSLESSERGWQVGTRTSVDVLNAQQQLYSAKRDLQQARYDTLVNGLKLDAAVGQLDESRLEAVNGWLK